MILFVIVVLAAVAFEYINGFHDAANAIATVVSTKVLTPRQAIAMAAFFNLTGALMGTAVASTIGKGIVDTKVVDMKTVLCALLGAIIWNLVTWWMGLPSSSSHALIVAFLMGVLFLTLRSFTPHVVHSVFGKLQLVSAAWMAHSHGTNDAQKTMGIIALALFTGTKSGVFKDLHPMFNFLHTPDFVVAKWVIVLC